jgi:hypothetical protein
VVSTTTRPPANQLLTARCSVTRGVCDENVVVFEANGPSADSQKASVFSAVLNEESTSGSAGSVTSMALAHVQGQPTVSRSNPAIVGTLAYSPKDSSVVQTTSRPGTLSALWAPGPDQSARFSTGVTSPISGSSTPAATSLVSRTRNPPSQCARYAR